MPDIGSCEPKHVAPCVMTLNCCVGRHIFFCLRYRRTMEFVCLPKERT